MSNKNGSHWLRPTTRLAIYLRDNFACVYCEKDLKRVKSKLRTIDHIIPRENRGSNHPTNLVTCCKRCNDLKGTKLALDFIDQFRSRDKNAAIRLVQQQYAPLPRDLARKIIKGEI